MDYTYFSKNVLNWYSLNKRDLPWRYKNNSQKDPYKIWVSEIMLQQTTVQTVIPYYKKFIKKWDKNKNLVLVTHYVVILEVLNYAPQSGEIVISNTNYKKIGNIEMKY